MRRNFPRWELRGDERGGSADANRTKRDEAGVQACLDTKLAILMALDGVRLPGKFMKTFDPLKRSVQTLETVLCELYLIKAKGGGEVSVSEPMCAKEAAKSNPNPCSSAFEPNRDMLDLLMTPHEAQTQERTERAVCEWPARHADQPGTLPRFQRIRLIEKNFEEVVHVGIQ